MVVEDDRRREHHAARRRRRRAPGTRRRWRRRPPAARAHCGGSSSDSEPPVARPRAAGGGDQRATQPLRPVRAGRCRRWGAVLDPDADHASRRTATRAARRRGDHADPQRLPGAHQRPTSAPPVAQLLGLGAARRPRTSSRPVQRDVERELGLARLVPRHVGASPTSSRSTARSRPGPLDRRCCTWRKRTVTVSTAPAPSTSTSDRCDERSLGSSAHDVLGHQHAPLPAHLVLRRAGAVGVEHVALVEHGVRDARALASDGRSPSSSRAAAVSVSSQPTRPCRPR